MSLHKHSTEIGRTVTYFVVFWGGADGSACKQYGFMVREHAPASLSKEEKQVKAKQSICFQTSRSLKQMFTSVVGIKLWESLQND